jgi:hypothetical protein
MFFNLSFTIDDTAEFMSIPNADVDDFLGSWRFPLRLDAMTNPLEKVLSRSKARVTPLLMLLCLGLTRKVKKHASSVSNFALFLCRIPS